ncbi:MAG: tRNA glutamyl-Q(34) synthetase GluQRS [Hellea sp.]|nr:tRNA glutamyl-Q(34) synthetase GluQRS [Hellea sp.]
MGRVITRFAPSPTGYLHLGHAYAAQQAFGYANEHGGICLLRIEDIDHTRCKPEYTSAIYEDLDWLGFDWPIPVRVQSQHRADYACVIDRLNAMDLLYRCFKTRKELPDGVYRGGPDPDEAARLKANEKFAWRLSIDRAQAHLGESDLPFSDEVLARKDIGTSYHVACCHDDALQAVTHVVRGKDIEPLTAFQNLLQRLMGWSVPEYIHHKLRLNPDGEKLSKRNHDTSIRSLRAEGYTAAEVLDMAQPW